MFSGPANSSTSRSDGPFQRPEGVEPSYCPRCRDSGESHQGLCRMCGEAMQLCGFCPTCEAFWKHPVGVLCPKHDLELEIAPPPASPLGQAAECWVTIATYSHPNEASGPRIRLEAEGISTFLDGARIAGSTLYQVATGGARLQVPNSQADAARILLAQAWSIKLDPEDPSSLGDDDDPWAGLGPDPGSRRRAVMRAAILIFLFGPALIAMMNGLAHGLGWFR